MTGRDDIGRRSVDSVLEKDVIETRVSTIRLGEDEILRVVNRPGSRFTLEDAKEGHEATMKIAQGRKVPILVDIRGTVSITREARNFYGGEDMTETVTAMALIVASPLSRTIGNFFLGFHRPLVPTKLFTNESEALGWLKEYAK